MILPPPYTNVHNAIYRKELCMEISQHSNCDGTNWLKSLQGSLTKNCGSGLQNDRSLVKDPRFLKAVLIAFLSMIGDVCVFSGVEITRVLDLDLLKGVPEDSRILFKVVQDYSGRSYLEITVHNQSFPLKKPERARTGNRTAASIHCDEQPAGKSFSEDSV